MPARPAAIDTNVVVSGLISANRDAPTCAILDGMIDGQFVFLLSQPLLAEYREVLLRPKIRKLHGLTEEEVDTVLTEIALNGAVRTPALSAEKAPDLEDQHLWDLVLSEPGAVLVTGDRLLLENPAVRTLSPAEFVRAATDS